MLFIIADRKADFAFTTRTKDSKTATKTEFRVLKMLNFDVQNIFCCIKMQGNIDVGDGCWRRNVLVTTLRC